METPDVLLLTPDAHNRIKRHTIAAYVAGVATLLAIFLSIRLIRMHLKHYTRANIQRPIIRIIAMVPIYALFSWLSLRYRHYALYLDLIRDAYEGFVLYSFVSMITNYAGGEFSLRVIVKKHLPIQHSLPFSLFLSPYINEAKFVSQCNRWVMQYAVVKPLASVAAIVLDEMGLYGEGTYSLTRGYLWLTIINSISVTFAMNALLYIYHAVQDDMKDIRPLWKLLCIKGVLFLAFWQSVVISLLAETHIVHATAHWTVEQVEVGLQDFLMCFEMVAAALMHEHAYGWPEFAKRDTKHPANMKRAPTKQKVKDVVIPNDVAEDMVDTFATKKLK